MRCYLFIYRTGKVVLNCTYNWGVKSVISGGKLTFADFGVSRGDNMNGVGVSTGPPSGPEVQLHKLCSHLVGRGVGGSDALVNSHYESALKLLTSFTFADFGVSRVNDEWGGGFHGSSFWSRGSTAQTVQPPSWSRSWRL